MIFFTAFVTLIRRQPEGTERRLGSPARLEGNTIRLPIGTEVQIGDYLEYRLGDNESRMMFVIDVIPPHMSGSNSIGDHIEVTCAPSERVTTPNQAPPVLHRTISGVMTLVERGQTGAAVSEAMRLVEKRVQSLTGSDKSGPMLMEMVFGARPPQLDITTTTGRAADDERAGFRFLFIGAMLALRGRHAAGGAAPITVQEALECLAVASMLMRRLDRAESRLN